MTLGVGDAEIGINSHDFTGGFHFRSEQNIDPRETIEGEDGLLDGIMRGHNLPGEPQIDKLFADYLDWIEQTMTTEDNPYLRIAAVLWGGG